MPLRKGKSKKARASNVKKLIAEGREPSQAVAIAYKQAAETGHLGWFPDTVAEGGEGSGRRGFSKEGHDAIKDEAKKLGVVAERSANGEMYHLHIPGKAGYDKGDVVAGSTVHSTKMVDTRAADKNGVWGGDVKDVPKTPEELRESVRYFHKIANTNMGGLITKEL